MLSSENKIDDIIDDVVDAVIWDVIDDDVHAYFNTFYDKNENCSCLWYLGFCNLVKHSQMND